jgi:hypothetical protein
LSNTLKSAYGPKGLNKMIINHLEKLFVTSDAATIIRELEIQHPAARLIVQASQMMEQEVYLYQLFKFFHLFHYLIFFLYNPSIGRRRN